MPDTKTDEKSHEQDRGTTMDPAFAPVRRRMPEEHDLPLWAPPPEPAPPTPAPTTSTQRAAHARAKRAAEGLREQVYRAICEASARGATRSELHAATGIKKDTINGRVRELVLDGRVKERGTRDGEKVAYAARWVS